MTRFLTAALGICLLLASGVLAADDNWLPDVPKPSPDVATQCVEPVDVMRRSHMDFLMHQRDRTMREGNREKQHSLRECVRCHVGHDQAGNTIAINAPGQFCATCHAFASVQMDCFECHATRPDSGRRGQRAKR